MQSDFVRLHLFAGRVVLRAVGARKKETFIKISNVPSIDSSCSKAISYKLDTLVSGGAQYAAREVTIVWNDA